MHHVGDQANAAILFLAVLLSNFLYGSPLAGMSMILTLAEQHNHLLSNILSSHSMPPLLHLFAHLQTGSFHRCGNILCHCSISIRCSKHTYYQDSCGHTQATVLSFAPVVQHNLLCPTYPLSTPDKLYLSKIYSRTAL